MLTRGKEQNQVDTSCSHYICSSRRGSEAGRASRRVSQLAGFFCNSVVTWPELGQSQGMGMKPSVQTRRMLLPESHGQRLDTREKPGMKTFPLPCEQAGSCIWLGKPLHLQHQCCQLCRNTRQQHPAGSSKQWAYNRDNVLWHGFSTITKCWRQ